MNNKAETAFQLRLSTDFIADTLIGFSFKISDHCHHLSKEHDNPISKVMTWHFLLN